MNNRSRTSLISIFRSFLRLGLTAFGGPAMVAVIGEMAVEKKGWLSREAYKDGVALAQSIPGATAMQTAGYCGLHAGGRWGALAAYVGFGLPAMILMIGLSAAYKAAHHSPISTALFSGLQVIVVAIVSRAVITFGRTAITSIPAAVIALAAAAYLMFSGSPFIVIVLAAAFGIALCKPSGETDGQTTVDPAGNGSLKWLCMVLPVVAIGLIALRLTHPRLFDLSALLMRIDALAFGGGFASIPLMLHQVVYMRHWMAAGTFMDGIAMGQVTPGPIVITATFVGYQVAGLPGAIAGTIAIFLPSFVLLVAIAPHFDRLRTNAIFRRAIAGVLASFVGLILSTAVKFGLAAHWSIPTILLCCGAFTALMLKVDILPVVVVGGVISVLALR